MPGASELSVCCLTADPGPRVAAMLEMLRPVAAEIVVAADSRADEDRLGHYAAAADRLLRLEVDFTDRHLGWLHAQCSGDWILRIDGDEVPAAGLIERLPELLRDRRVSQYLVPRRWLYGDSGHWLAELPWWPDYQLRLVRNDGTLRFAGTMHTTAIPVRPARYLEEPIYHLDLLVNSLESRRAKAAVYERREAGMEAPGGGAFNERFYMPETGPPPRRAEVPGEDRALIDRALEAPPCELEAPDPLPGVASVRESDRFNPGRTFDPEAYAASAASIEPALRMRAGERRALHLRFTNEGTEWWPWDTELGPPIRASYRLRNEHGAIVVGDGPRTPFPCAMHPGDSTVVPLDVVAPVVPGTYTLEADVVHEGVRWFGCDTPEELVVAPPPGWDAVEASPPRSRARRVAARLVPHSAPGVPKILHRVWLGGGEMPEMARQYGEGWERHHPGWEHRLWGDEDIRELVPAAALRRCRSASERSNLVRYAVLAELGGVYVDTDMECMRPFDGLMAHVTAFAGLESADRVGTAVIGSVPHHPVLVTAASASRVTAGMSISSIESTGPGLLTLLVADRPDVELFGPEVFYPYRWDESHRRGERFEAAYAVHHWDLSWMAEAVRPRAPGAS